MNIVQWFCIGLLVAGVIAAVVILVYYFIKLLKYFLLG